MIRKLSARVIITLNLWKTVWARKSLKFIEFKQELVWNLLCVFSKLTFPSPTKPILSPVRTVDTTITFRSWPWKVSADPTVIPLYFFAISLSRMLLHCSLYGLTMPISACCRFFPLILILARISSIQSTTSFASSML